MVGSSKITGMIPINKPIIGYEEIKAVTDVLSSGVLTDKSGSGPQVLRFEKAFARYIEAKYAVAFNNGTSALHASLLAADVGLGDEVIVPSFTFVATAESVALAGARLVFADIDPKTYCIDLESLRQAITERTKAIIPVHLYGLTVDMAPIMELARRHDITVIEDAAQAHGAEYHGKKAGVLGDMACFSFYASKNMTTGEGGMVTTNNMEFMDRLHSIRVHGERNEYRSVMIGHNYRLPEIEAAIGHVQLSKLPGFLEKRRKNAAFLLERLAGLKGVEFPVEGEGCKHSWYVFTIRLKGVNSGKRDKVVKALHRRQVGAAVYYPIPIHRMLFYREQFGEFSLPETEKASRQVISLPVHPAVDEVALNHIARAVENTVVKH